MIKARLKEDVTLDGYFKGVYWKSGVVVDIIGTPTIDNMICVRFRGITTMLPLKILEVIEE